MIHYKGELMFRELLEEPELVTPTRQQAQDLILLVNRFIDNSIPGTMSIREVLDILSNANLTLSFVGSSDRTAEFALQLLDHPNLSQYDPSIEIQL